MTLKSDFSYNKKNRAIVYLVPTPIGNISDITLRAKEILSEADIIASEDTRNTSALLHRYDIRNKRLVSCYSQTEEQVAKKLIKEVKENDLILAYCSDAGSPGISDPGSLLVLEAIKEDVPVTALPGPTALIPALTTSGFDTSAFTFIGFLPVKSLARKARLEQLKTRSETLIFYEAPHRLLKMLTDLAEIFGGERRAVLSREISKLYEQHIRGSLSELLAIDEEIVRGEFVIVVEGLKELSDISDDAIKTELRQAIASGSTNSDAVKQVSDKLSVKKNRVYKLVKEL